MKEAIAILTGGGPAPGINAVIASVTKTFLGKGYRVIGLHGGYRGLFTAEPDTVEIDHSLADAILPRGGAFLQMSRFKPSDNNFENDFNLQFFKSNNIVLLVTIGGDDTASTANRVASFLDSKKYPISNIHVPKTIDNDLPLPGNSPTFGYQSALDTGTEITRTVLTDAHASGNWFVLSAMGRSAGHLAWGIGLSCHLPMTIIPEMFNKTQISVDKIVDLVVSSIIKRKIMGINFGAAMISEGVFHCLNEDDIIKSGVCFSYDEHGHPELGKVSKAHIFNTMIENKLAKLEKSNLPKKLKVKTRPVEIGYAMRCRTPVAYDLVYCSQLGMGVWQLFDKGNTGCMVYVDHSGDVMPLCLKELEDNMGKIPPRLVDVTTDSFGAVVDNILCYITPDDYAEASQYVSDPAEFDFFKILQWEDK